MAIKLCKPVKPWETSRWFYGFCWHRYEYADILVAVIPLNLLMRLWIAVIFWLRHPFQKLDSPITYTQLMGEINKLGMEVMDEKCKRKAAEILLDATRKHVLTLKARIKELEACQKPQNTQTDGSC